MTDTYSISDLSREFAITTRAIRFYEDKRLLAPLRVGTNRVYSRSDRTRLKLVLRGKRLGWPLNDIKELLDLYDQRDGGGEMVQLEKMITKLEDTRQQLQLQQQDLLESLAEIDELEANCRQKLGTLAGTNNSAGNPRSVTDSAAIADLSISD